MLKIALTSGIACGKSTIAKLFAKNQIFTVDCDKIVSRIYSKDRRFKKFLKKNFGTSNKREVSRMAFSNPKKMKKIENFVWPVVLRELKAAFSKNKKRKLVLAEVPLLFEAKMENIFDVIVVVNCAPKIQLLRAMRHFSISRAEALKRIKLQMPLREKVKRAHYVIDNGKSLSLTRARVNLISAFLIAKADHLERHEIARKLYAKL